MSLLKKLICFISATIFLCSQTNFFADARSLNRRQSSQYDKDAEANTNIELLCELSQLYPEENELQWRKVQGVVEMLFSYFYI
jgi:hypothetical protein